MATQVPRARPPMGPTYLYTGSKGLELALYWQKPEVTNACAVDNSTWSVCLDGVARGAMGPLKQQLGEDGSGGGAVETLFPEEILYLTRGMADKGFRRL